MDRQIVLEKLESLRRCLNRIEEKRPDKLERLQSDVDIQDIITPNLTTDINTMMRSWIYNLLLLGKNIDTREIIGHSRQVLPIDRAKK
jgi:hypothetical protein